MIRDEGAARIEASLRVRAPRHVVAMVDRQALRDRAAEVEGLTELLPELDGAWVNWWPAGGDGEAELQVTVYAVSLTVAEGIVERALDRVGVPAALIYTVL